MVNPRKIIWMCHHYSGGPGRGPVTRGYELCRNWNALGHEAHIISASFHHQLHSPKKQKKKVQTESVECVSFHLLKVPGYTGNGLRRILNMMTYGVRLFTEQKKLVSKTGAPDVVIAATGHPFHLFSAWWIAKKNKAQFIMEVRDAWFLSLTELLNLSPRHPFVRLIRTCEGFGYRKADRVVSLFPKLSVYLKSEGLPGTTKVRFIPNGVEAEKFQENLSNSLPENLQGLIHQEIVQGRCLLGYAGALGKPNALEQLLDGVAKLKGVPLSVFLLGKGSEKTKLQRLAREKGLDHVHFCDPLDQDLVPAFLNQMDGLFIGYQSASMYRYGLSSKKLFEYMASGKPIVCAANATDNPLALAGGGWVVEPYDVGALMESLEKLAGMPDDERVALGGLNQPYVREHHSWDRLATEYLAVFV